MAQSTLIKPTHKALADYYATLADLAAQSAATEGHLRRAFSHLLSTTAKIHNWILLEEDSTHSASGDSIRYDGTLRDAYTFPRGRWEAKGDPPWTE